MKKSKQAKAREFPLKARKEIADRDNCRCIFCEKNYQMEKAGRLSLEIKSIMHYIPRSKNGKGIPQNGAVGCQYHHNMLDNGNLGNRKEMLEIFREYLKSHYPDWNEKDLVYSKWGFLEKFEHQEGVEL